MRWTCTESTIANRSGKLNGDNDPEQRVPEEAAARRLHTAFFELARPMGIVCYFAGGILPIILC